jgi:hypothetical protein
MIHQTSVLSVQGNVNNQTYSMLVLILWADLLCSYPGSYLAHGNLTNLHLLLELNPCP